MFEPSGHTSFLSQVSEVRKSQTTYIGIVWSVCSELNVCFFPFSLTALSPFFYPSCMISTHLLRLTVMLFVSAEHKVIIVGLDNAGKTTILYQL